MTLAYLTVPFSYRAQVFPSSRHRAWRVAWLRGEIMVEVPTLWPDDYEPAFELPEERCVGGMQRRIEGDRRMVLARGGSLYAPLLVKGEVVDLAGAAAAFVEPEVSGEGESEYPAFDYAETLAYPLMQRFVSHRGNGPLRVRSLANHVIFNGWTRPRTIASDQSNRTFEAAAVLTDAFAIVDDIVYVACPEPAWTIHQVRGRRHRLMAETQPWATGERDHFRLDRHRDALAWARQRRIRLAPSDITSPIDILQPGLLTRSDELELARDAAENWTREAGGGFYVRRYEGDVEKIQRTLASLAGSMAPVDERRLEQVRQALDLTLADLPYRYNWPYLARLSDRWNTERAVKAHDLFSWSEKHPPELAPEDLAALQNLY